MFVTVPVFCLSHKEDTEDSLKAVLGDSSLPFQKASLQGTGAEGPTSPRPPGLPGPHTAARGHADSHKEGAKGLTGQEGLSPSSPRPRGRGWCRLREHSPAAPQADPGLQRIPGQQPGGWPVMLEGVKALAPCLSCVDT